ncbi:MAG: acyl-CoA dehydrogenase C-terminal domain-containing protein [Sphingomonadales bacterium]|nr:acyl-CoA dehydrogenase C-terminal domain-containing protein [Sphingomonadales bacterium]
MATYAAPVRDTCFVVNELLDIGRLGDLPGFAELTPELVATLATEAGRFTAEVIAPLNAPGDRAGCTRHADGTVTTPAGFREAYAAFREAGWGALSLPTAFGGQGLPQVLGFVVEEYLCSANQAFAMYPGLTNGAINALLASASPELQRIYLPKLVPGEWTATMNLTEPHCGTDLGLIRTRAVPQADGSHAITGTKIFISAGEHDLADNIVHLVLAKTPDAPAGSKGISLFVVPKFLPDGDGNPGARNAVSCGSLEHKMGIHGNATCVMNYDGATGWLVGEENRGLAAMFVMMNAARLGVGIQGLGQAEVAYQNGAAYARERRQGRALTGAADPGEAADLLVVQPDVRRMLMEAKAFTEGMRALALWVGLQVDLAEKAADEAARTAANDIVGLLTPVIKGYGTDKGFDTAVAMQQVWGGHGYIVENGMEQFVRDARIAMIYEGANGVQAMDLVGRKLAANGGRGIQAFFAMVDGECAGVTDELASIAGRVAKANGELKAATMWFMQNALAHPDNAGAGASAYLHMTGIVALGLMWLRMAKVAQAALAAGSGETAFYEAKLITARFFAERMTPQAGALRRQIEAGADSTMALPAEAFGVG